MGAGLYNHMRCMMEELLKRELGLKTLKAVGGRATGGCINNGQSFHTDKGSIFVKSHDSHKVSAATLYQCRSCSCRVWQLARTLH